MPQRGSFARHNQTASMRGFRQGMHTAQTARRNDGFERRRVRGVLQLRTLCSVISYQLTVITYPIAIMIWFI